MPSLPDYLQDWPEAQRVAETLGLPWEDMKGRLLNQGMSVAPHDRVSPELIYEVLQKELDAGRGWTPDRLLTVRARRLAD